MDDVADKRRWSRYSLRTLFIVTTFCGVVWWWHTWPERTARRFVRLLADGEASAARRMLDAASFDDPSVQAADLWRVSEQREARFGPPNLKRRTAGDVLTSSAYYNMSARRGPLLITYGGFTARCGRVHWVPEGDGQNFLVVYRLCSANADDLLDELSLDFGMDPSTKLITDIANKQLLLLGPQEAHSEFRKLLTQLERSR